MATVVWGVLAAFVWLDQARRIESERAVLQADASTIRARLESELNATLSLSLGLSSFVLADPEFSEAAFEQVAASLLRLQPAIRSVALAPDNVIRRIYPLEGNAAAIGLDYMKTPTQREAVLRLMREKRPVIAGPIELVQGGTGIINRIPILFNLPGGETRYWGLASVAIDPEPVFERAGLMRDGRHGNQVYALRGKDGLGAAGAVFRGEPALFADSAALVTQILIPGGSWELALRPVRQHARPLGVLLVLMLIPAMAAGLLTAYSLRAHQRIRSMAHTDSLTGLANRRQFQVRGDVLVTQAQQSGRPLALVNLDIDDFKAINDHFGHAGGDAVLVQVAAALSRSCRAADLIARVGGDEFLILLPDTAPGEALDARLESLRQTVHSVLPHLPPPAHPGVSLGVAVLDADTPTLDALLKRADEAMYQAKFSGVTVAAQ